MSNDETMIFVIIVMVLFILAIYLIVKND